VRLGFAKATGDVLMILDGRPDRAARGAAGFYDVIARGLGDYVQGTRLVYPMQPGAMRFFNRLGNQAFSHLFTYLLQQPIKDTLCGTKVLRRRDYRAAGGCADTCLATSILSGDFDSHLWAARLNLKIAGGSGSLIGNASTAPPTSSRWKHGWLLLKMSAVAASKLKYV